MGRLNLIERRMERFLREPPSVRIAAGVIVVATTAVVVGAGVLISLIDNEEYPNIGIGMWWALQTVTTVGYGDVAPTNFVGRIVGAAVMLEGTAFIAIVTAVITSSFVARATSESEAARAQDELTDRQLLEKRINWYINEIRCADTCPRAGAVAFGVDLHRTCRLREAPPQPVRRRHERRLHDVPGVPVEPIRAPKALRQRTGEPREHLRTGTRHRRIPVGRYIGARQRRCTVARLGRRHCGLLRCRAPRPGSSGEVAAHAVVADRRKRRSASSGA